MPDFDAKGEHFTYGYDLSEDAHPDDYAWNEWTVYPNYEPGEFEGGRFLYVDDTDETGMWFRGRKTYKPLSRQHTALFLKFARWPEEYGMSMKPLAPPKNEAAMVAWAKSYGLLGFSKSIPFTVMSGAREVVGNHLGTWNTVPDRTRNLAMGGHKDTVEAFAREAWLANTALRLYEAASWPEGPDMEALEFFMPDRSGMDMPSIRDLYSGRPKDAQDWALRIVGEIVEGEMQGHVWPIPVRDSTSIGSVGYSRGWGFDSLLGAMWLQMSWFMSGKAKRCEWCGRLLDIHLKWAESLPKAPKTGRANISPERLKRDADDLKYQYPRKPRSDRRFCDNGCKALWNYHRGEKANSKAQKKKDYEARKKVREGGNSDAT